MDPFSIVVGALALAQLTTQLTVVGNAYIRSLKNQPSEIHQLLRELGFLSDVLHKIVEADAERTTPPLLRHSPSSHNTFQDELERCAGQLKELRDFLTEQLDETSMGRGRLLRLRKRLRWPLKHKETMEWIARIERSKGTFQLWLEAGSRGMTGQIYAHLIEMKKSQQEERMEIRETERRQKHRDVLAWLAPTAHQDTHMAARKLRRPGTGQWLLECDEYTSWKAQSGGFLWLNGCSGSGKTILSSIIIDDLSQTPAVNQPASSSLSSTSSSSSSSLSSETQAHLAYFYFDRAAPSKTTAANLYGSLISQILSTVTGEHQLPPSLERCYDSNPFRRPSESALEALLIELLSDSPAYTIIIDAMDECTQRASLLRTLPQLKARILVTSQEQRDIDDELWELPTLALDDHSQLVHDDIARFVADEVARLRRLKPTAKEEVIETIVGRRGTFRWTREALGIIARKRTDRDIALALRSFRLEAGAGANDSGIEDMEGDEV